MQETPRSVRSHSRWSLAGLVGYLGILIGVLAIASAPQLVVAALIGAIVARYAGSIVRGLREAIAGSYLRVRRARPQHDVVTRQ